MCSDDKRSGQTKLKFHWLEMLRLFVLGGGGQREGVGGGGPHPLLVDGGLVPGGQLLHPQAGVGRPVLGREGVERPGPQAGHVGGWRRAQVVQERRQGAAPTALQRHS